MNDSAALTSIATDCKLQRVLSHEFMIMRMFATKQNYFGLRILTERIAQPVNSISKNKEFRPDLAVDDVVRA